MKKNNVRTDDGADIKKLYRIAKQTDIDKYNEAKSREHVQHLVPGVVHIKT